MKLVNKKFGRTVWLENNDGKICTESMKLISKDTIGPFIRIYVKQKNRKKHIYFLERNDYMYHSEPLKIGKKWWEVKNKDWKYDLFDNEGKIIALNLERCYSRTNGSEIIIRTENGKYGCLDEKSEMIIPCIYNKIKTYDNTHWLVEKLINNNKCCAIFDEKGKKLFEFVKADNIVELERFDYFCIVKDNKVGVIDNNGKEIIGCFYDDISSNGNFFILQNKGKYGLAKKDGTIIFECIYPEIIETEDKFIVPEFGRKEIKKAEYTKS